ncbi:MAG: hypothetical protein A2Y73_03355 [Chloroflexi bacterium RBG_13_56_8]|nr:MAG: hypothetical protein A2Y73_03355 [Chloroflexi bacterium RBG_13_56_8]
MMSQYRILVIDDDPIFVKTTTSVLESHGYQVDSAKAGKEGLARMRERLPELVLLDIMMDSVLEGLSVSQEMWEDTKLRDVPIIMITSIRTSEYRGVFPQDEYLHVSAWLDKPCPPDRLISEIEAAIERHERFEEGASANH